MKSLLILFAAIAPLGGMADDSKDLAAHLFGSPNKVACHENGMVHSWCSGPETTCALHPSTDIYACQCLTDRVACPDECIGGQEPLWKDAHSLLCKGIPEDEPNYVLVNKNARDLPLHHCENNAIVANWCNEATLGGVDCLLLPALDEYVCTCHGHAAACPTECVDGSAPDKQTHSAVRCSGIPVDEPNYVLLDQDKDHDEVEEDWIR